MLKKFVFHLFIISLVMLTLINCTVSVNAASETEAYVTAMKLGTIRNDFTGFVGMKITIGSDDLKVTSLGRIYVQGSTEKHKVKLVDAENGKDINGGVVEIKGGTKDGSFTYADFSTPIVLAAHKSYYIVTEETAKKDKWYDLDTRIIHTSVAVCDGLTFQLDGKWIEQEVQSAPFGPVDFKYEKIKNTESQTPEKGDSEAFIRLSQLGKLRNDYSGWVGMRITVGSSPITVTSLARVFIKDNKQIHTVKIVDAVSGDDVPEATVFVSGGTNGKFTYVDLARPVVLQANKNYYLVTDELAKGDLWYDGDSRIITNTVATADGIVYLSMEEKTFCKWIFIGAAGATFGPVDFKYVKTKAESEVVSESKTESNSMTTSSSEVSSTAASVSSQTSEGEDPENNSTIIIISIAAIVVLAIAAGVIFYIRKKKKL